MYHNITYLSYKKIDKAKWDQCIINAPNSLIYGTSWYLDQVCEHWDGLILGDYEAVMPLPWKRKYGLKYIIQPLFTKQLGVFGNVNDGDFYDFIRKIPKRFVYVHFSGNYQNDPNGRFPNALDQVIDMKDFPNYNKSTRYNIRKAEKNNLISSEGTSAAFLEQYKNLGHEFISKDKIRLLEKLFRSEKFREHSYFQQVTDENHEILSILWIMILNRRGYLISSATPEAGKKQSAKFLAIHSFLEKHKAALDAFDFVGSGIPGVYDFNRGFGAVDTYFPDVSFHIFNRRNNLLAL